VSLAAKKPNHWVSHQHRVRPDAIDWVHSARSKPERKSTISQRPQRTQNTVNPSHEHAHRWLHPRSTKMVRNRTSELRILRIVPQMRVIVIIIEVPIPRIDQEDDGAGTSPRTGTDVFRMGGCCSFVPVTVWPSLRTMWNSHRTRRGLLQRLGSSHNGWDIQPKGTSKGRGGKDSEGLVPRPAADHPQGPVGEDVTGDDEEDGDHDMARYQQMEDG